MFRRSRQGAIEIISGNELLTGESLKDLAAAFEDSLANGQPKVVFDMEHIPIIDSAGLEWLLEIREEFEERMGALKIAAPNSLCSDILSVTGVGSYFEMFPEVQSAVGSFTQ